MYLPRLIEERFQRLLKHFPVVVVSGARQVGKTTLVENTFGREAAVVTLDPVVDVGGARSDPELFLANRPPPLAIDEVQYAPDLVAVLKRRVDADRSPGQYVLTGSQQWGVLEAMAESLSGRAVFLDLEGFSILECARLGAGQAQLASPGLPAKPWLGAWLEDPDAFVEDHGKRLAPERTLFEWLWRGSLPDAQQLPLDVLPDFHLAYQRTYVERDVRLLAEVSDWQLFGRFVRLAAALTAQEINYSQLGRELGLNPQTARKWLALLEATYQWDSLPAWSGNAIKRVSGRPKGYLTDTGVAAAAQAIPTPEALGGHPLWGPLFETAVVGELRKQMVTLSPPPKLYHWRSHGGAEVDVVAQWSGRLFPMEIKAASRVGRGDTRGISAFRKTYPGQDIAPGLVIGPVPRFERISALDYAMPWDLTG